MSNINQLKNCVEANWHTPSWVQCFTTTRFGGCSSDAFSANNLGLHVQDNPKHVQRNRLALTQSFELPTSPVWLNQTHGECCIEIHSQPTTTPTADAATTRLSDTPLAVMTADCLPIALFQPNPVRIAVIHAGWRGLVNNLLTNTLQHFENPTSIQVWLGPCIQQQHYQVSKTWLTDLYEHNQYLKIKAAVVCRQGHYFLSLPHLATLLLNSFGIDAIAQSDLCTMGNPKLFYSYRRDQGRTGRMATIVCLNQSARQPFTS